jgi:uncharacterized protein (DUF1499 family)
MALNQQACDIVLILHRYHYRQKMSMNNILWQLGCVVLLFLSVMWNRAAWGDPKWPLLGLAVSIGLWVLLALYVLISNLWSLYQGTLGELGEGVVTSFTHSGTLSLILPSVLAILPLAGIVSFLIKAGQVPSIHDISTDTNNPPKFVFAENTRHPSHNSLVYTNKNAELQRQAYSEVKPLLVSVTPLELMTVAETVVIELGWEIDAIDKEKGLIEARSTTSLLRFVDDIIIRVERTPEGGSKMDVRSASRIGVSDLGANAERIRLFLDAVSRKLGVIN